MKQAGTLTMGLWDREYPLLSLWMTMCVHARNPAKAMATFVAKPADAEMSSPPYSGQHNTAQTLSNARIAKAFGVVSLANPRGVSPRERKMSTSLVNRLIIVILL